MSLCDSCMKPGACCHDISISGGNDHDGMMQEPMSFEHAEHLALRYRLPFRPLTQDQTGAWRWWCGALQRDGRCGIYETRPELCKSYVAGSDPLCVHYWPNPEDARQPNLVKAIEA